MAKLIILLFLAALAGCTGEPTDYAELSRRGPSGVAIDGYSPVSYFTSGQAERGRADYAVSHNGVTYWLTDADPVSALNASPNRYQPAHGGWCSLMLTGSGQLTPANPESFKIIDDRLLLFWSGYFNGQTIDGSANWHSRFQDPQGELELLGKADTHWAKLLAGKAKQKIVLFKAGDGERIHETRRTNAKEQYD